MLQRLLKTAWVDHHQTRFIGLSSDLLELITFWHLWVQTWQNGER